MKLWKRRQRMAITRREIDQMLDEVLEVLLEAPDETKERYPECRWRDTERLTRNDAVARLWDIKACLRNKLEIPEYFKMYNLRRKD